MKNIDKYDSSLKELAKNKDFLAVDSRTNEPRACREFNRDHLTKVVTKMLS